MIAEFLNIDLVKELELDSVPEPQQTELINQMNEVIDSRISLEALSLLSEEDKLEMDKVLDSDGDVLSFFRNKIPNFDIIVSEIVANFKKEVLELHNFATKQ